MTTKIKNNKTPIIITILLTIIILITSQILIKEQLIIDNIAYKIFVENLRNNNLTPLIKIITKLSETPVLITIIVITLLTIKNKKIALTIPINLSLIVIINQILKQVFKRARPIGYRLLEIGGYSFPSGHAMTSTAFYGLLIFLTYKYIKNKNLKIALIILNILTIIGVGISRIYLGVHYCSDVLVGQAISIIYLIIYTKVLKNKEILA